MKFRKHVSRLLGLVLTLAMLLTTAESFTVKTSAAETKTTTEYFAYRVDVMDAKKGNSDCVTLQVLSSIDGAVYAYVKYAGAEKPTTKDIMGSGYKTWVTAGEEIDAYAHIYWLDSIDVGKKYDIYIVFEDPAHNTYGPFTVKKWVAKYFPAGKGTKKKPYQIWTARHLFNMTKYTGEDYKGKYFKVMQDIDLTESIYSGRVCSYASTFYGIFDGNGKTIRHLKGNLFDNLESTAIVRNVYVADADTTLASSGGIAGVICESNKGIIEKCAVYDSELSCSSYHGIIAGFNHEWGIVRNCASIDCKDYAYDSAGGIVGRNEGKVQNCYSNITIKGDASAGGIVGINFSGTVSGCLGTITTLPKGDKPNTSQNIGGIVGTQAGTDAYIENCTSLYLPEDTYDLGDVGSIWGGYNTGGYGYPENATGCVGAVKYTIDDIQLTEKEINGSTNETYLAEQLEKKRTRFVSHHGASADTVKEIKNPVEKLIAGGNPDGKNKAVISNLSIKYTHIFENETKAYNAKKKFPMTQKELKVKEYSTPGKVKIKKVKADPVKEQVTFTWDSVKKAEGYEVYVAKWRYSETGNKYGEYELEETIKSANATEYTDKYMYKTTQYFYKVRAYWTVSGVKVYGPFSDVQAVKLAED